MISLLRSLLHTTKVQMKLSMARPMFQFIILISPFMFSTMGILIYGKDNIDRIFHFVVLGSGFMTLWSSIVFSSASDINRERFYGTLELIFVAPVPFAITLIGKIIGNTFWGILSMAISFLYLWLIYRVDLVFYHPLLLIISLFFAVATLSIFAFFLAMFFTLSRQAEALMNCMEYPIYLICGFLFPISFLPKWVQPISWIMPPTWTIELLRSVTKKSIQPSEVLTIGTWLLSLTAIFLFLATFLYKLVDKRARIQGKLGVH